MAATKTPQSITVIDLTTTPSLLVSASQLPSLPACMTPVHPFSVVVTNNRDSVPQNLREYPIYIHTNSSPVREDPRFIEWIDNLAKNYFPISDEEIKVIENNAEFDDPPTMVSSYLVFIIFCIVFHTNFYSKSIRR